MKKIFLLTATVTTLFIFVLSCSENDPNRGNDENTYQASWDANTESDFSHYDLYVWSGLDSTQSPFEQGTNTSLYTDYFVKSVSRTSTTFMEITIDKLYIQAALSAVNLSGKKSLIGVSNILKVNNGIAVSKAENGAKLKITFIEKSR